MIRKLLGFSRRERHRLTPLHLEALVAEIVPTVQRMLRRSNRPRPRRMTFTRSRPTPAPYSTCC